MKFDSDFTATLHASDYVFQLRGGVAAAENTVADYVVTDALSASLDDALSVVQRALASGASRGAFVHGARGTGKSHFMAVLHLLLTGNASARAIPGLQAVLARQQGVLDARLLAIDYHLLGKATFESALFAGYLQTVTRLHAEAEPPVLHQSDGLLSDAAGLRASLGDEQFFAGLNEGIAQSSGWGELVTAWTPVSYAEAADAPVGDLNRDNLINALVARHFRSYRRSGEWLGIEPGLKAIAKHARSLGYDGVVFFLDELVLWLAQHLSDARFIQEEASKVAKLVDVGMSTPVPLISFVSRQGELKDSLALGPEKVALGQSFQWWEDRYERIEFSAAGLPHIVRRRLLQRGEPGQKKDVVPVLDLDAALSLKYSDARQSAVSIDAIAAGKWWDAGFDPDEVDLWLPAAQDIRRSESSDAALSAADLIAIAQVWRTARFLPAEAVRWRRAFVNWDDYRTLVHEVRLWRAAGFDPEHAANWHQGFLGGEQDLEFAVLFSNAGWSPREASLLYLLAPVQNDKDWDSTRRAWLQLNSPRTLDYVKAGLTPAEAAAFDSLHLSPEALHLELRARFRARGPFDQFFAMHINLAVFIMWAEEPHDLPFFAEHIYDMNDSAAEREAITRSGPEVAGDKTEGATRSIQPIESESTQFDENGNCPGSGGPGHLDFRDGMEDWYVHCPVCGITWMGGNGTSISNHRPRRTRRS